MPIRPELLVRDANGIPQPPAELVKRIDEKFEGRVRLRYASASWAVEYIWPPNDRRWALIQSQEIGNYPYDIVGSLPPTCSLDEAPAYLERMLRAFPKDEVRKLLSNLTDWNMEGRQQALAEEVMAATRDEMGKKDEITSAIFPVTPVPTVAQQQDAKAKSRRRPKGVAA